MKRDATIDALRGLCLLGIALVNVPWIGSERYLFAYLLDPTLRAATPIHDLVAAGAIEWLAEGKFYPQFSMLFGLGAGVMLSARTLPYVRRIAALTVLGLLHSAFGWYGDILLDYAAVGILLAVIWRLPSPAILGIAIALFALACVLSYFFDWAESDQDWSASKAHAMELYKLYVGGSFWDITADRWHTAVIDFLPRYEYSYRANTFAMACFGLWVKKHGLIETIDRRRLAIAAAILIPIGLALAIAPHTYVPAGDLCAVGYACAFLWLAQRKRALVRWLAPIGRCAISAYLGQTAIFTLVFYSYGLGLYGRFSPLECALFSSFVWMLEVALARLWMERFALGPVEWLWRAATYLEWPSMLRGGRLRA